MKLSKNPKGFAIISMDDRIVAQLYNTVIFKREDGVVQLNSGGWRTMHTKKCLNLIFKDLGLPLYVTQKKGEWYVLRGEVKVPFTDNMKLEVA
jgi:hypothetical protein